MPIPTPKAKASPTTAPKASTTTAPLASTTTASQASTTTAPKTSTTTAPNNSNTDTKENSNSIINFLVSIYSGSQTSAHCCCCFSLIAMCISLYKCANASEFTIAAFCPCYYFFYLIFHELRNLISPCVAN